MKKALEIIKKNGAITTMLGLTIDEPKKLAKEIHEHYMKFTDWMMKGTFIQDPDDSSKYWNCLKIIGEVSWSLDEVHQYYCDKILKNRKE